MCFLLHPDRIDQHFMVCEHFRSDLGNIYPKVLQPMEAYTSEQMKRINADPLYKEFMEFKDDAAKKYGSYEKKMNDEDKNDIF